MHDFINEKQESFSRRNHLSWIIFVLCMGITTVLCMSKNVRAEVVYQNNNGYQVVIDDKADLLTAEEENSLKGQMQLITEYGNVAFCSIDDNSYSADYYAENYFYSLWGYDSGTVFLIDMDNRMIYIYSDGAIYRRITKSYANTITDNVYTYATDGNYYACASKVYEQIYTLLEGGRIAQPMKYISNAFLAMIISFIILYFCVHSFSKAKKPTESQLLEGILLARVMRNPSVKFTHESKTYSPQSSGSSSSGGGGGGDGGGGGGGGHSF